MDTVRIGTFTNFNGDTFNIKGCSPLLFDEIRFAQMARWEKEGRKLPEVPFYTTQADEVVEWDYKSVMKDGTDKEKLEWEDYQALDEEFENEYYMVLFEMACMLVQDNPDDDKEWLEMMSVSRIDIPKDGKERKILYGRTRIIVRGGSDIGNDLTRLLFTIKGLSGAIDEKQVAAFEASFRAYLQAGRTKTLSGNDRSAKKKAKVGSKPGVLANKNSALLENKAK